MENEVCIPSYFPKLDERKSHWFVYKKPNKYEKHLYTPYQKSPWEKVVPIPFYWKNCHEETPDNASTVLQNLIVASKPKTKYFWEQYTRLTDDQLTELGQIPVQSWNWLIHDAKRSF